MEFFSSLDDQILLFFNGHHTAALDAVMWQASSRIFWVPMYLLLAIILVRKTGVKRGILCLAIIGLLIFTADQICASLIRPIFCRLRPSSLMNPISEFITVVHDYRGGSYGFPSCHAANTFALATFLSLVFRRRWATIGLLGWAMLVSGSRIYLGVHYPSDILVGGTIGAFFAFAYYNLYFYLIHNGYQLRNLFKMFRLDRS